MSDQGAYHLQEKEGGRTLLFQPFEALRADPRFDDLVNASAFRIEALAGRMPLLPYAIAAALDSKDPRKEFLALRAAAKVHGLL